MLALLEERGLVKNLGETVGHLVACADEVRVDQAIDLRISHPRPLGIGDDMYMETYDYYELQGSLIQVFVRRCASVYIYAIALHGKLTGGRLRRLRLGASRVSARDPTAACQCSLS
eukprot:1506072-Pleurochrysis_carterae.AAC.2